MSAPFHKILSKLERAIIAYIIAQSAGTASDTLPGKRSAVKTLPVTIAWGKHYERQPEHGTEFMCDLTLSCKYSAPLDAGQLDDDNRAAADLRAGKVFGSFTEPDGNNGSDIPDAITAAARAKAAADALLSTPGPDVDLADFTCLNIAGEAGDSEASEANDVWIDSMELKIRCSPYNVS